MKKLLSLVEMCLIPNNTTICLVYTCYFVCLFLLNLCKGTIHVEKMDIDPNESILQTGLRN